jgi:ferredoxin-NADP reductase
MALPDGFEFEAGQFLTLRIHADGREHVRCYSISSSPDARNYLDISVKRLGLVSRTLHETLGPGSMMSVKAPAGTFVYPAGEDRPIVLIAGGIGITPLMSVLRHAVFTEPTRPVTLFYSVRTEGDVAFREEIHNLARCDPQLRLAVAITAGTTSTEFFAGRLNGALIRTTVPEIAGAVCLICGPQPMIDAMRQLLTTLGVPPQRIRFEVFDRAVAASGGRRGAAQHEALARGAGHHATHEGESPDRSCEAQGGGGFASESVRPPVAAPGRGTATDRARVARQHRANARCGRHQRRAGTAHGANRRWRDTRSCSPGGRGFAKGDPVIRRIDHE